MYAVYDGQPGRYIDTETIEDFEYISARDIAKICSAQISWYRVSGKIVMKLKNHRIAFFHDTKRISIDDKKMSLKRPSYFISNKVYIPLSFILSKEFCNIAGLNTSFDAEANILEFQTATNIGQPKISSNKDYTRIVFELRESLSYKIRKKRGAYKVSFHKGCIDNDLININDKLVKNIELKNHRRSAVCKIVLNNKSVTIDDEYDSDKLKLTLDIKPKSSVKFAKKSKVKPKQKKVAPKKPKTTIVSKSVKLPKKDKGIIESHFVKRIVVDPGHGGKDPGAIGPNGTLEKDINLKVSKRLAKLLKKKGYEVFLTRKTDTFIPLIDRTNFANEKKADVFISIHCNSSSKKKSRGWEIFFLSEKATDDEAAQTAAFENAAIMFESIPTRKQAKVQELLWAMVVNEFMNEASELCGYITEEVENRLDIKNRGVKQGGFHILKGAQMPAVVVECGFISNKREEMKMKTRRFQRQICDAIYFGIKEYDYKKNVLANSNKKGG